eukprot:TRINITY_DN65268_c0_g1_i1.p1 TRINITY_DN65268_c0_g1~~TRINITY_DN65268_c0_g1_i1.p1  ORF type:complete len:231 (+),score=70.71 TRINITY_DN65268_c0_g1_i1:91-783(+)
MAAAQSRGDLAREVLARRQAAAAAAAGSDSDEEAASKRAAAAAADAAELLSIGPDWAAVCARALGPGGELRIDPALLYRLAAPPSGAGAEGESPLRQLMAALVEQGDPPDVSAAHAAAVDLGHVQVAAVLGPLNSSPLKPDLEGKAEELLSWSQGARVGDSQRAVRQSCEDAGIEWTAELGRCCGQLGAVLALDALLPHQLTELDTLTLRFSDGSEHIFPPAALSRVAGP